MTSPALDWFLKAILLAGSVLMAFKLYRTGLYRRYPILFAYFVFRIPNSVWTLFLSTSSATYQKIWICTDVIVLSFYILIVSELYRLVLEKYKGIYTLGRWAMYVALSIAVVISALSLIPRISPMTPQRSKIMAYVFAADRGVNTALVIFIVLLLLFLSRYPLSLSRNVRIHAVIYSIFFVCNTFVMLMRALFGLRMVNVVNTAALAVMAACVVAWVILLTPQGAETPSRAAGSEPQFENHLLTQLDTLNATLLKVSRRSSSQVISQRS